MQSAEPMKLDMDITNWWEIEGKCVFQFLLNRNPYKCWQSFVQRGLTCEKSCWNVSFYVSHVLQIKDFSFFFIITREWWLIRWMRLTDSIKHISRISWCGTRYQLWEWNSCVRISSFSVFQFEEEKNRWCGGDCDVASFSPAKNVLLERALFTRRVSYSN